MIHYDISYDDYAQLPGWRWSDIRKLQDGSPLSAKHGLDHPAPDTARYAWLRAVHCLVLEPDNFAVSFSVFAGVRRGKLYEAHKICHPGTAVLTTAEANTAAATAAAVLAHPSAAQLIHDGQSEVSVTWTDERTGLPCKGRLDSFGPTCVIDLKTAGTVHERKIASLTARNLWHGQLAHYAAGLAAHGVAVDHAHLIVAEGRGAQDVAVYRLDGGAPDGALHAGECLRRRLLAQLADCVDRDEWPGRHPQTQDLCLPAYALEDPEFTFGSER